MRSLAIVIIGKNEQLHIKKCLRSVISASKRLQDVEIVYVDSASTDRTIEIAASFPIKIIQLKPEWKLTSAAGRYLGYLNTTSKHILFVDGDTLLYKHWPEQAVQFLEDHPKAGGVAGILHEIFTAPDGSIQSLKKNRYKQKTGLILTKVFGGTACYKREAMLKAGSFNPHIRATPELELALRIRQKGYNLYKINKQMAITYAPLRETFTEIIRRSNSNLYAVGNTLRYCKKNELGGQYVKERMGFILIYFASILLLLTSIAIGSILKNNLILIVAGLITSGILAGYILLKRSVYQVVLSIFKRSVILYNTLKSYLFMPVKRIKEYPVDVKIIKINKECC